MRQRLPTILTLLLISGAFVAIVQRDRLFKSVRPSSVINGPEDVVWRASDAAKQGDVQAYLSLFDGPLRERLQRAASDMGEAQFSSYLKRLSDDLTGIAVSDLVQTGDDSATLRIEFVYRGRNEVQQHQFKRVGGDWKIVGVGDAEWLKGLVPWGTDASGKE